MNFWFFTRSTYVSYCINIYKLGRVKQKVGQKNRILNLHLLDGAGLDETLDEGVRSESYEGKGGRVYEKVLAVEETRDTQSYENRARDRQGCPRVRVTQTHGY